MTALLCERAIKCAVDGPEVYISLVWTGRVAIIEYWICAMGLVQLFTFLCSTTLHKIDCSWVNHTLNKIGKTPKAAYYNYKL